MRLIRKIYSFVRLFINDLKTTNALLHFQGKVDLLKI